MQNYSLIAVLRKHVLRHPYWYSSVAFHVLLLAGIYFFGSMPVNLAADSPEQQASISKSVEKTTFTAMHEKLKRMQEIKKLLEESTGNAGSKKEESDAHAGNPTDEKTPESVLNQAKKIADEISTIRNEEKAKQLADLLKISKEEAIKKVIAEKLKQDSALTTPYDAIKKMEDEAIAAIKERKEQLDREKNGAPVQLDKSDSNQHGNSETAGKGVGGSNPLNNAHNLDIKNILNKSSGDGYGVSTSAIKDKINDYVNNELPLPKNLSNRNVIEGYGEGQIPEVNTTALQKGKGLTIGSDGDFTNRFFVNTWYLIGPFAGNMNRDYKNNAHYSPERAVVLDAVYEGKNNRSVQWEYVSSNTYPLVPPYLEEDSVYYGYTELNFEKEATLWAWIGADDDVELWLNGEKVFAGNPTNNKWFFVTVHFSKADLIPTWNLTEKKQLIHFKKGRNKLFFKLSNGPEHGYFSLILTERR